MKNKLQNLFINIFLVPC